MAKLTVRKVYSPPTKGVKSCKVVLVDDSVVSCWENMKYFAIVLLLSLLSIDRLEANGQTYTKAGSAIIDVSNSVRLTLQVVEPYVVEGDALDELKEILRKYLKDEWWVLPDTSGEAVLPSISLQFQYKGENGKRLLLRIPLIDTTMIEGTEWTKVNDELTALVERWKLPKQEISADPKDYVKPLLE